MQKEVVIIIILAMVGGFFVGWFIGFSTAIHGIVDLSKDFIDIDYQTVSDALTAYKERIHNCYG